MDHRFHLGGVRPFPSHGQALEPGGMAAYGCCRSHSRFYWGLRLFLVCTPAGMPITWALASPKIDEREALTARLDRRAGPPTDEVCC